MGAQAASSAMDTGGTAGARAARRAAPSTPQEDSPMPFLVEGDDSPPSAVGRPAVLTPPSQSATARGQVRAREGGGRAGGPARRPTRVSAGRRSERSGRGPTQVRTPRSS